MVTRTLLRSALRLTVSVATRSVIATVGVIAESPVTLFESPSDGRKKARTTKNEMTARASITLVLCESTGRFIFTCDMMFRNLWFCRIWLTRIYYTRDSMGDNYQPWIRDHNIFSYSSPPFETRM